jgi:hypothetical protein
MENRYITKSGKIIWTTLTVSPLWIINEYLSTHIAIVKDILLKKSLKNYLKKVKDVLKAYLMTPRSNYGKNIIRQCGHICLI